jgi:alkylation response protein AidB-like acyl-CoA dehydrogenase
VAAESLDRTIVHVLARHQFGRPIGSFQGVKFMLADTYVALERARSLTFGAAAAIGQDPFGEDATHLSMLAKASSAEIAVKAAGLRVQLMGAMGLTREADAHLFVRRAQQTSRYLGTSGDLYARVGSARFEGALK